MTGVKAAQPRVSYAELERWPEDGRRYERYDGEVYVVPSLLQLHQIVSARLYDVLRDHVRVHGGIVLYAPLDLVLTDYDVVQPDTPTIRQRIASCRIATAARPEASSSRPYLASDHLLILSRRKVTVTAPSSSTRSWKALMSNLVPSVRCASSRARRISRLPSM